MRTSRKLRHPLLDHILAKKIVLSLLLFFALDGHVLKVPYESCFEAGALAIKENKIYERFYEAFNDLSESKRYIIPNVIHFIWLGSPLPDVCREMIETWKHFHPNWVIKVWNDADVAKFGLQNIEAYNRAVNYGEKSDIFRYEILYRYGGVYVDTDFEAVRSFDALHQSCAFYVGNVGDGVLLNALIGSVPHHPIVKACIDHLKVGAGDHDPERILQDTGPYHLTRMFLQTVSEQDLGQVVPFPPTFFYPFPGSLRNTLPREQVLQFARPETFAIHYWSTSWQKK